MRLVKHVILDHFEVVRQAVQRRVEDVGVERQQMRQETGGPGKRDPGPDLLPQPFCRLDGADPPGDQEALAQREVQPGELRRIGVELAPEVGNVPEQNALPGTDMLAQGRIAYLFR